MTGEASWIDLVPVLLGGIGLAILLLLDRRDERRYHRPRPGAKATGASAAR
jgi:hypothetical protein